MRRNYSNSSRKHFYVALAVILSIAIATFSLLVYAVSHSTSVIDNDLDFATSSIQIIEDSDPGFGKKEVTFKNVNDATSTSVLIRIAYSETWTNNSGTVMSNTVNGVNVVAKSWTTAFVSDFVDGQDGWYYYEKVLAPGDEVKVINSISLSDQSYAYYNYDFSFRYETVQATPEAASAIWGKTATIGNNGEVTWAP